MLFLLRMHHNELLEQNRTDGQYNQNIISVCFFLFRRQFAGNIFIRFFRIYVRSRLGFGVAYFLSVDLEIFFLHRGLEFAVRRHGMLVRSVRVPNVFNPKEFCI